MKLTDTQLVARLNKALGTTLTTKNFDGWFNGTSGVVKFDAAVQRYLGNQLYESATICARVYSVLYVKLGGTSLDENEMRLARTIIKNPAAYTEGFDGTTKRANRYVAVPLDEATNVELQIAANYLQVDGRSLNMLNEGVKLKLSKAERKRLIHQIECMDFDLIQIDPKNRINHPDDLVDDAITQPLKSEALVPKIGDKHAGFTVTEVRKIGNHYVLFGVKGRILKSVIKQLTEHFAKPEAERGTMFRPGHRITTL